MLADPWRQMRIHHPQRHFLVYLLDERCISWVQVEESLLGRKTGPDGTRFSSCLQASGCQAFDLASDFLDDALGVKTPEGARAILLV